MYSSRSSGWIHVVLNYVGPNNGQGIRVYNGAEIKSDVTKQAYPYRPGAGRVVIGRQLIDEYATYVSVDVDELLFFNEALTDQNIQDMNN